MVQTSRVPWAKHPDADDRRVLHVEADVVRRRAAARRVVGLGAICDHRSGGAVDDESASFSVGEFVVLDGGERVLLHVERGFTTSHTVGEEGGPRFSDLTRQAITENVLNVVFTSRLEEWLSRGSRPSEAQ